MASKNPATSITKIYQKRTVTKTDLIRVCLLARPATPDAIVRHIVQLVFGGDEMSTEMLAVIKNRLKKKGVVFADGRRQRQKTNVT